MSIKLERAVVWAFLGGVLLFLFIPTIVVVLFAFEPTKRLSLPMTGVSLKWFGEVLNGPDFQNAIGNSIQVALVAALSATIIGTAAAFGLSHLQPAWRRAGSMLFLLPAVVPGILIGMGLVIFVRLVGIETGLPSIMIAHTVVVIPFVVLTVGAQLDQFDRSLLDAARDLGASGPRASWDVTVPLVRTAVVGAAFLALALSLDEFVVTFFVNGGITTGPLLIWGMMRLGIDPSVNALATMILAATVALSVISGRATRAQLR